jgi:hypothetical protein
MQKMTDEDFEFMSDTSHTIEEIVEHMKENNQGITLAKVREGLGYLIITGKPARVDTILAAVQASLSGLVGTPDTASDETDKAAH